MRFAFNPIISDVGSACESQGDCSSTSRKTDTVIDPLRGRAASRGSPLLSPARGGWGGPASLPLNQKGLQAAGVGGGAHMEGPGGRVPAGGGAGSIRKVLGAGSLPAGEGLQGSRPRPQEWVP